LPELPEQNNHQQQRMTTISELNHAGAALGNLDAAIQTIEFAEPDSFQIKTFDDGSIEATLSFQGDSDE
jgi:hypothetical protein